MISAPAAGTFVHLGHVGFNYKGEIETSDDIEPGWTMMLAELQGYGVTSAVVGGDNDGSPMSVKASPLAPVDTNVTPAVAVDPEQGELRSKFPDSFVSHSTHCSSSEETENSRSSQADNEVDMTPTTAR